MSGLITIVIQIYFWKSRLCLLRGISLVNCVCKRRKLLFQILLLRKRKYFKWRRKEIESEGARPKTSLEAKNKKQKKTQKKQKQKQEITITK